MIYFFFFSSRRRHTIFPYRNNRGRGHSYGGHTKIRKGICTSWPVPPGDAARPRRDPPAPEGPRPHPDGPRPSRGREPVDDREDREEADEPVLRRRPPDHELPPDGAQEAGEEGPRGADPDEEGPVRRREDAARRGGRGDAPLEVLPDARVPQRPLRRLDLGQGHQQPHPLGPGPPG